MARLARSFVRLVVVLVLAGALVTVAVGSIAYSTGRLFNDVAAAKETPIPGLVTDPSLPSVIYAANGSVMATLRSSLYRQPVRLAQISPILVEAVLDTEDHSFWKHGGLDIEATARALLADVNAGAAVQGGSTIAQQLVKNTYLTDQKTLSRKVREAVLAERLEQKYTKTQVLDAYLNSVYLGSGAYGVEAAAKEYFNKDASQLDLPEAALLAGLIQAPSAYDPIENPEGAASAVARSSLVCFITSPFRRLKPSPPTRWPCPPRSTTCRACRTPRSGFTSTRLLTSCSTTPPSEPR